MKARIACVYMIENLINSKKYIGQTVDFVARKNSHKCNATRKNYHLCVAMRKYGYENFQYTILIKDNTIDHKFLNFWECYFIGLFGTLDRTKGYNLEGGGNLNKICSEEKRKKISMSLKGRIVTDTTREKMRKSQTGRKGVLSNSYGRIHSMETNEKCGLGSGTLYRKILKNGNPAYGTCFGGKSTTVKIAKYPMIGKQLIIMERLCMENDINFQPKLIKDMLFSIQKLNH
jgi:group I intron endonuclease